MAKKYRVGIIGRTGKGDYGHGVDTVWKDIPQTEVIAVADEHPGGRAQTAMKTGAKAAYADYREMLEKEKLDIVAVALRWIDMHRDMNVACAEHGCHVYMEKPFCRTLEEADDIVRAFEMRHLKLAMAHVSRYSPVLPVIAKLIAGGEIGDVLELRGRGKEDPRGGAEDLWVLGSHVMDLMRVFGGDVETCFGRVTVDGRPVEKRDVAEGNEGIGPLAGDAVSAVYTFKGNRITGYFASQRKRGGNPSRFGVQIMGSKGVVEVLTGYGTTCYLLKDPSWSPGRSGAHWVPISSQGVGLPEKTPSSYPAGHTAAINDLIAAIETDKEPNSGMYAARAATEMIVGVFESHRLKRPATFPLENRKNPLTMLDA